MNDRLTLQATGHVTRMLHEALHVSSSAQALVMYDGQSALSRVLTDAYRSALPDGRFVDFDQSTGADLIRSIQSLQAQDLVVLVQSTHFRLNEFRLRIELFRQGLKTIEHLHLGRMSDEQIPIYIDALGYGTADDQALARTLKARLDAASRARVVCDGTELVYTGGFEPAKLNIGDYTGMTNVGGTFPIGEVFTEARDLTQVNGEARVFGFAHDDHRVRIYDPFLVQIEQGILSAPNGPPAFQDILDKIRLDEPVLVREFGVGLNRAMGKDRVVNDITAFERQCGLHLSLGAKHAIYAKPGLSRKHGRYHVDIFIDAQKIFVDDEPVFQDGTWR